MLIERMRKRLSADRTTFIDPCLPTPAAKPPSGSNWIHEIKHDGYRLMARRDPVGIRLLTKRGTDWSAHVAPTELVPVLVAGEGVVLARFGIHRLGSGDKPRPPLLNVRTDGMRKGQFRKHLKERRCVIPCEGFYEWRDEGGKQPYYFSRKDGKPLMLAGIWEIAEYKGDSRVAFAILTDEPNELVASYHDRMPLSLADDKVDVWLDLANASPLGGDLLLDLKEFTVRPMDRAMNNVRQKNLAAIDPEAAAA